MNKSILTKYAKLIIKSGVNLEKGQTLVVRADVIAAPLVREVARCAYKNGAANVIVKWGDEQLDVLGYSHRTVENLTDIRPYTVAERDEWADKKYPFVAIVSDDPDLLASVDSGKVSASRRAAAAAFKRWRDGELAGEFHWTIVAYPSAAWAKKVFPDLSPARAVKELEGCIIKAVRLDAADPIAAWEEHSARLASLCARLNRENIASLRYVSGSGTDITVGLPDNYVFMGGSEKGQDGRMYNANMPTEEVFSAPHRDKVDGIVHATLPLSRQGKIIDKFWMRFESGRVVDFGAQQGYDVLKNIIETDEGSHRLGEVALVPYDSPIRQTGILFYETLFDENASCHFALGGAYASSVEGGENMREEERLAAGLNVSNEHVDFMIGSRDLEITATRKDGSVFKVFEKGNFAI